jgi:hypothetical protein
MAFNALYTQKIVADKHEVCYNRESTLRHMSKKSNDVWGYIGEKKN